MNKLTRGQTAVLAGAAVPMVAFGALGAFGTYSNITSVFHRSATALGVVAAGEGATLVLALVSVGLVMLGQSVPAAVRAGLWALPLLAAATGAAVAQSVTEAIVFAITPMAMTVSAEGLGLLARRIVVHRTGIDAEAQRRNAETVQQLAYHRARAANHPNERARKSSERRAWRLAKRVGVGDAQLGAQLVEVQRERLREGADVALAAMYGTTAPALEAAEKPAEVTTSLDGHFAEAVEVVGNAGPLEVVTPQVSALPPAPYRWDDISGSKVTTAVPAEMTREVVTEVVAITPAELRRQARQLNREVVTSTKRPVTIQRLQDEFGLSRREATELRRQVVTPKGDDRS